ncbi:MAG: M28 family peptidase [Flavobacteriales bacterium]|nr:M28 family peptidase [Flavobacteriales bacterium]
MIPHMHLRGSQMRLAEQVKKTERGNGTTQIILVDAQAMQELLGEHSLVKLRKKKRMHAVPVDIRLAVEAAEQRLTTENVLAYIEGTDKKDELVVLTAHYDHVGVEDGVVYNGADDDGTGTVAMIEIAEAFAMAKAAGQGPRRSVLVMPVSGEEKGLLGSRYYSEHPVFPLANTVADLNIDMIGRRDSAHADSEPYIYVIGSDRLSTGLHEANEKANSLYSKLTLDYTFNAESDPNRFYYRSDHYNFARKGIPSLFYFSGIHEDYHQPGDDVEKIDIGLLHQRILLAFHTAWILANQEERIAVDKPIEP